MTTKYNNKPKGNKKMNIHEFIVGIEDLQKDSNTLEEIKKVLNGNGETIDIVEQITNLKNNTSVTNITILNDRLAKIERMLDDAQADFTNNYDEVSNAMSNLEDVCSDCDYIYDASTLLETLKSEIADATSNLHEDKNSDTNTAQPSA